MWSSSTGEAPLPKLNCPQLNRVLELSPEKTLMENLIAAHIPVASSCGGDGICGKCRMLVITPGGLPPPSELERKTLYRSGAKVGERLSCQLLMKTNGMVETTYW